MPNPRSTLTFEAHLPLASYRQDKDCIDPGDEAIKRHIAMRTPPNHQFTHAAFDGPANERIVGQNVYCLHDLGDPRLRILDLEPGRVVQNAIEIVQNFRRDRPCQ